MQNPVIVEVFYSSEQLNHQSFHFPWNIKIGGVKKGREKPQLRSLSLSHPKLGVYVGLTWQKRLLHGFHQAFEVVFNVVHHYVDLIHVATHDNLLDPKERKIIAMNPPSSCPLASSCSFIAVF